MYTALQFIKRVFIKNGLYYLNGKCFVELYIPIWFSFFNIKKYFIDKMLKIIILLLAVHCVLARQSKAHRRTLNDIDIVGKIKEPLKQMFQSGIAKVTPSDERLRKMEEKKNAFRDKANEISGNGPHTAVDGMITIMGGVPSLVEGIKDGDVMTALSGINYNILIV